MTKTNKENLKLGRTEAVQRLQNLAEQIERGTVLIGGNSFRIPDNVRLEIKADDEELDIELKWQAPVVHRRRTDEELPFSEPHVAI